MLCSSFKGVLPSDLFDRYDSEGGWERMELDLLVAAEMSDRIVEQTADAKDRSKAAVARRNQKRVQKMDSKGLGDALGGWLGGDE